MRKLAAVIYILLSTHFCQAEDGYRLWLRYDKIKDVEVLNKYRAMITSINFPGTSPTLLIAKKELQKGLKGLLEKEVLFTNGVDASLEVVVNSNKSETDGFSIKTLRLSGKMKIQIEGFTEKGVLYATFHFLRLLQTNTLLSSLNISSSPKYNLRLLNHWDNLDRTVERGYAGFSIWNWHQLPQYIDQRYIDYVRANASIGINGTVLTNVNANALILTKQYLEKVRALADVFRPYGIKVYLTARFSAPIEIGKLKTADPLDPGVQTWWKEKVKEIYQYIPDFGGFLVKANSEGQPGPQNYNRTHADGANMLADAVAPFKGIVMWRAFVYSNEVPEDRVKQAYSEFKPLDGQFRKNVLVQVKNGPLDFQPREPFSPLFGAMERTPLMMEFQITQEYLGQGTHLVYEAPLFKETLDDDTYQNGKGSTVASRISGVAGVSNIGNERNWTNHPFAQANWYAYGRLAWDPQLSSEKIAEEWIRQTFSNNQQVITTTKKMMMASREAVVNYMTPLGLAHLFLTGHHYGPGPWISNTGRADWNPVYYHRADSAGIGFDRTSTGSNALEQYAPEIRKQFASTNTIPEKYILWFHRLPWNYRMKSGRSLWNELCYKYQLGVDTVRWVKQQWETLKPRIDEERFQQVKMFLNIQEHDAVWWKNACLLYFQTFSKMEIPAGVEKPSQTLEYYQSLKFPFAPGN